MRSASRDPGGQHRRRLRGRYPPVHFEAQGLGFESKGSKLQTSGFSWNSNLQLHEFWGLAGLEMLESSYANRKGAGSSASQQAVRKTER